MDRKRGFCNLLKATLFHTKSPSWLRFVQTVQQVVLSENHDLEDPRTRAGLIQRRSYGGGGKILDHN